MPIKSTVRCLEETDVIHAGSKPLIPNSIQNYLNRESWFSADCDNGIFEKIRAHGKNLPFLKFVSYLYQGKISTWTHFPNLNSFFFIQQSLRDKVYLNKNYFLRILSNPSFSLYYSQRSSNNFPTTSWVICDFSPLIPHWIQVKILFSIFWSRSIYYDQSQIQGETQHSWKSLKKTKKISVLLQPLIIIIIPPEPERYSFFHFSPCSKLCRL